MDAIVMFDILSEHGIMMCESLAERQLPEMPESYFEPPRSYRYGQIKLTVFRRKGVNR